MFFENERIINKQLKFVKIRAYTIIQDLEGKGLSDIEIASCIGLLMKDETTEYQKDVLDYALKTVNSRQEQSNAVQIISNTYSFVDGRIQRKIRTPVQTTNKRKTLIAHKNRKK